MREYDLWGPWTGNALHAPANPPRRRIDRSWFAIAALIAIIVGGTLALVIPSI